MGGCRCYGIDSVFFLRSPAYWGRLGHPELPVSVVRKFEKIPKDAAWVSDDLWFLHSPVYTNNFGHVLMDGLFAVGYFCFPFLEC